VLVTPEIFGKACGSYFTKYSWRNATLDDFINHLDQEFSKLNLGFSLQEWKNEWIQTAGLNEIEAIWAPTNNVLKIR
jgi:aminopeptidase N